MVNMKAAIVPVTPLQQNCSLVWNEDSKRGVVVDPGGDVARIRSAIEQVGIEIERIILTHGHIDHAGGAADLRDQLGVGITGPHRADGFLLESLEAQAGMFGMTDVRDVTPDTWLEEGDMVSVAGLNFEVFHCPGHSPGSVVLVEKELRFALVGDVLFNGSIGRTDFPYGDGPALIHAVRTKLFPLGDDIGFICGHGPTSSFGAERERNPFVSDAAVAQA